METAEGLQKIIRVVLWFFYSGSHGKGCNASTTALVPDYRCLRICARDGTHHRNSCLVRQFLTLYEHTFFSKYLLKFSNTRIEKLRCDLVLAALVPE